MEGLAVMDCRFGAGNCFLPYFAIVTNGTVLLTAVGALIDNLLALLGRTFLGWMPCRAGAARKILIGALRVGVPVLLALYIHSTLSLSAIGPIGVNLGLPNRALGNGSVGHNRIGEFYYERALSASWLH